MAGTSVKVMLDPLGIASLALPCWQYAGDPIARTDHPIITKTRPLGRVRKDTRWSLESVFIRAILFPPVQVVCLGGRRKLRQAPGLAFVNIDPKYFRARIERRSRGRKYHRAAIRGSGRVPGFAVKLGGQDFDIVRPGDGDSRQVSMQGGLLSEIY